MPKVLFLCGSANQTTMYHKIYTYMDWAECYFSPIYLNGYKSIIKKLPVIQRTILGDASVKWNLDYCLKHDLPIDHGAKKFQYDLVIMAQDAYVPENLKSSKWLLVQEGTIVPDNIISQIVKTCKLPAYLANTTLTGLSNRFEYYCVGSEGYKHLFMERGVQAHKLVVTGMPNFDDAAALLINDFAHKDYVLVATSCLRENYKYENRIAFLQMVKKESQGQKVIFKLHPRESVSRATNEILKIFPDAPIYSSGNTDHMIANCHTLITKFSSVLLLAAALDKKIICDLDQEVVAQIKPIQNEGRSAFNISNIARKIFKV